MSQRPESRHIPQDIFFSMVEYGVTPSMNLLVRNPQGEFLFFERLNEPVKGHLWIPGGRMRCGESLEDVIHRIAKEEIGIGPEHYRLLHISDRFQNEMFPTDAMNPEDVVRRYGKVIPHIHYWATVAYMDISENGARAITLDEQSSNPQWKRLLPDNPHPYVIGYFRMAREAGLPVPPLPEEHS